MSRKDMILLPIKLMHCIIFAISYSSVASVSPAMATGPGVAITGARMEANTIHVNFAIGTESAAELSLLASAQLRAGGTTCESTVWLSETSAACKLPLLVPQTYASADARSVVATVAGGAISLSHAFTYDVPDERSDYSLEVEERLIRIQQARAVWNSLRSVVLPHISASIDSDLLHTGAQACDSSGRSANHGQSNSATCGYEPGDTDTRTLLRFLDVGGSSGEVSLVWRQELSKLQLRTRSQHRQHALPNGAKNGDKVEAVPIDIVAENIDPDADRIRWGIELGTMNASLSHVHTAQSFAVHVADGPRRHSYHLVTAFGFLVPINDIDDYLRAVTKLLHPHGRFVIGAFDVFYADSSHRYYLQPVLERHFGSVLEMLPGSENGPSTVAEPSVDFHRKYWVCWQPIGDQADTGRRGDSKHSTVDSGVLPSYLRPSEVESIMFTQEQIKSRVVEIGADVSNYYRPLLGHDEQLLVVGILKGAFVFMADLVRTLDISNELDFMQVSSYGDGTVSSGKVKIKKDLSKSVEGRHVLIVEDILDTGTTFKNLIALLQTRKPASLRTCALLHKHEMTIEGISADHVGYQIDNAFVVGYGLDYAERYRSLPFIAVLDKGVILDE